MSIVINVALAERSYEIRIQSEGLGSVPKAIAGCAGLIVSDSNVDPVYGARFSGWLESAGCRVSRTVVPAGEGSKSLSMAERLYGEAVAAGLDRSSFILALGGGMVGDLAGFVAGTFLRGIALVQAPTTLLAMVDSSVGGKTAVNLPQGKNLVGLFAQPVGVAMDISTLRTLPDREYRSGLAEVVKYGVIADAALFGRLERDAGRLMKRDPDVIEEVVARCCAIKADVVSRDERESGPRAILNFGHTLGHAVERVTDYGMFLHGEAVAIGMAFSSRLSVGVTGLAGEDAERIVKLLGAFGLPVRPPAGLDWKALRAGMGTDKKTLGGTPRFVLADRIGKAVYGRTVDEGRLEEVAGRMGK
jgi:3-dehydroquinate synthase